MPFNPNHNPKHNHNLQILTLVRRVFLLLLKQNGWVSEADDANRKHEITSEFLPLIHHVPSLTSSTLPLTLMLTLTLTLALTLTLGRMAGIVQCRIVVQRCLV